MEHEQWLPIEMRQGQKFQCTPCSSYLEHLQGCKITSTCLLYPCYMQNTITHVKKKNEDFALTKSLFPLLLANCTQDNMSFNLRLSQFTRGTSPGPIPYS